jgi:hypothetical protein
LLAWLARSKIGGRLAAVAAEQSLAHDRDRDAGRAEVLLRAGP